MLMRSLWETYHSSLLRSLEDYSFLFIDILYKSIILYNEQKSTFYQSLLIVNRGRNKVGKKGRKFVHTVRYCTGVRHR